MVVVALVVEGRRATFKMDRRKGDGGSGDGVKGVSPDIISCITESIIERGVVKHFDTILLGVRLLDDNEEEEEAYDEEEEAVVEDVEDHEANDLISGSGGGGGGGSSRAVSFKDVYGGRVGGRGFKSEMRLGEEGVNIILFR